MTDQQPPVQGVVTPAVAAVPKPVDAAGLQNQINERLAWIDAEVVRLREVKADAQTAIKTLGEEAVQLRSMLPRKRKGQNAS